LSPRESLLSYRIVFQTVYNYIGLGLNFEIRGNGIRSNETKHVELLQFLHAFTSRGFDSVSWGFLFTLKQCILYSFITEIL